MANTVVFRNLLRLMTFTEITVVLHGDLVSLVEMKTLDPRIGFGTERDI